jgi:hypothetical protein
MRHALASVLAASAVAAAVVSVACAHPGGWWWTVQKTNQSMFWWSATHGLDTTCRGVGPRISSPFVEYNPAKPTEHGTRQAEVGQPLFHRFRCRSVDLKTGRVLTWTLRPTGQTSHVSS